MSSDSVKSSLEHKRQIDPDERSREAAGAGAASGRAGGVSRSMVEDSRLEEGRALHRAGRVEDALAFYDRVLATHPEDPDALHLKGLAIFQRGQSGEALSLLDRAIAARPETAGFHLNRGVMLAAGGRFETALADFAVALDLEQDNVDALFATANAQTALGRLAEARDLLQRAIAINPGHARALANLGNVLRRMGRLDIAIAPLARAAELAPQDAEIAHSYGVTLAEAGRHEQAIGEFRRALQADSTFVSSAVQLFKEMNQRCDWARRDRLVDGLVRLVREGRPEAALIDPQLALYLPLDQRSIASVAVARAAQLRRQTGRAPAPAGGWRKAPAEDGRIAVGYLSPDFRDHPVAHLSARIFTLHDRRRFRVLAYSLGPDDNSPWRREVESAADEFVDLRGVASAEAADRIAADGIDILVDMAGHTLDARPEILALHPASLLVGWLGYCGSMGGLNDYVLADELALPLSLAQGFGEAVVHLPETFMPIDDRWLDVGPPPDRAALGLPEKGMVLAAFSAPAKIEPGIFGAWMRILERFPAAVLWLRERGAGATMNLRKAASAAGIDPRRLVFAPRLDDKAAHLARHRAADLFLDTAIYGAHTTATDALMAGLPVLTCAGQTFQSRVGASLCTAALLADMVTHDLVGYEQQALRLLADPDELADIRARLDRARTGVDGQRGQLFDSTASVRRLERAYTAMWRGHIDGQSPASFAVAGDDTK